MRTLTALTGMVAFFSPALAARAAEPAPPPAVFGVGFTNVEDASARLVFTTSRPMIGEVVVRSGLQIVTTLRGDKVDEIHAFVLAGLTKGQEYLVDITATAVDGSTAVSRGHRLVPEKRSGRRRSFPGYTIIGSGVPGERGEGFAPELAVEAGMGMVRLEVSWDSLMPARGVVDEKRLGQYVHIAREMKSHGIEPLVLLDYCVPWAKTHTDRTMTWRHPAFGPPDDLADWEQYVRVVMTALGPYTRYYEIWNEPDAGYLATGQYVERPNLPAPIGRPPFKDNWEYWLGDRYAPMVRSVRTIADEVDPDALLMNGGWNRDYGGRRGDLLLERGMGPDIDLYSFHTYSGNPTSSTKWHQAIPDTFVKNIDRIFEKHGVSMPLAITEWGMPAYPDPDREKGFVSYDDAKSWMVKSLFTMLAMERVEALIHFTLGQRGSPVSDPADPYALISWDEQGNPVRRPHYATFRWLTRTFNRKPYRAVRVSTDGAENLQARGIRLTDSEETYVAVWQDAPLDREGRFQALPARPVEICLPGLPAGSYRLEVLDREGEISETSGIMSREDVLRWRATLPEAGNREESRPLLYRLVR